MKTVHNVAVSANLAIVVAAAIGVNLFGSQPLFAQSRSDPASKPPAASAPQKSTASAMASAEDSAEGEVRRIDKSAGKLTLRHGPIKNLDMPGMTMAFTVKDPALLDKIDKGDKVRFSAVQEGSKMVVTAIEAVK